MDNTKTEWQRGWENALESVWASLHNYPNAGNNLLDSHSQRWYAGLWRDRLAVFLALLGLVGVVELLVPHKKQLLHAHVLSESKEPQAIVEAENFECKSRLIMLLERFELIINTASKSWRYHGHPIDSINMFFSEPLTSTARESRIHITREQHPVVRSSGLVRNGFTDSVLFLGEITPSILPLMKHQHSKCANFNGGRMSNILNLHGNVQPCRIGSTKASESSTSNIRAGEGKHGVLDANQFYPRSFRGLELLSHNTNLTASSIGRFLDERGLLLNFIKGLPRSNDIRSKNEKTSHLNDELGSAPHFPAVAFTILGTIVVGYCWWKIRFVIKDYLGLWWFIGVCIGLCMYCYGFALLMECF